MEITARQLEIIEAAGEILTHSGINGLTTKSLAAKMGFSESALYRHFPSKESIILTMLRYLAEDMDLRLRLITRAESDPRNQLVALFNSQFDFFTDKPHFLIAMLSDGLYEESESINQAISRIMEIAMEHLIPIIRSGQRQGTFNTSISPESICHIIMGSFRLLMMKWRLSGLTFDIRQKGNQQMTELFKLITSPIQKP